MKALIVAAPFALGEATGVEVPVWGWSALVATVVVLVGRWILDRSRRKLDEARAGEAIANTSLDLVEGVHKEMKELRAHHQEEMKALRTQLDLTQKEMMVARDEAREERAKSAEAAAQFAILKADMARAEAQASVARHDLKNEILGLKGRVAQLEIENERLRGS